MSNRIITPLTIESTYDGLIFLAGPNEGVPAWRDGVADNLNIINVLFLLWH